MFPKCPYRSIYNSTIIKPLSLVVPGHMAMDSIHVRTHPCIIYVRRHPCTFTWLLYNSPVYIHACSQGSEPCSRPVQTCMKTH